MSYLAFTKSLEGQAGAGEDRRLHGRSSASSWPSRQIWRGQIRPEAERVQVATNPHSPPRFRVIGPLYNMPEFFEAFGATPEQAGDRMNPKPVRIW